MVVGPLMLALYWLSQRRGAVAHHIAGSFTEARPIYSGKRLPLRHALAIIALSSVAGWVGVGFAVIAAGKLFFGS